MKRTKLSLCISMVGVLATLPAAYANEIVTNCTQVSASSGSDTNATNNESCVDLSIPFDYGDAPDPSFAVLATNGGASHQLGTDVYLGKCVDGDSGTLQGGASADDANAGSPVYGTCGTDATGALDDEDGVAVGELHVAAADGVVQVTANAACKLNAWIDWNQDGSWGGAGEQVYTDQALKAGVNDLILSVPEFAKEGEMYARFRCSTTGGDGIGGEAADGEVEDYKLTVLPAIPATPVAVGDYIWEDTNHDGKQDSGEAPLAGITVSLLDQNGNAVTDLSGNVVADVTTDAAGKYLFSNLPEGDYQIRLGNVPTGYLPTVAAGDVDDVLANDDSNCSAQGDGSITSSLFTLTAGGEPDTAVDGDDTNSNLTVDCGLYKPTEPTHSLGNRVWIDNGAGNSANANNGIFDSGEGVVADGVLMELRDSAGKVINSTTTADGYYLFSGLAAGDYQVCVAASNFGSTGLLAGYKASTGGNESDANANVDNNDNGSDDTTAGLCSNVVSLGSDEPTGEPDTASGTAGADGMGTDDALSNLTVDFAVVPPQAMAVGDTIWVDANKNGQQDSTETGLAGAVVTLVDSSGRVATDLNGNSVLPITTGSDGKYLFSNLPEGEYTLFVEQPDGYSVTTGGADPDADSSNTDNNCRVAGLTGTIQTPSFTLTAGAAPDTAVDGDGTNSNLTVDCGFYQPDAPTHSIGSRVWIDDGAGTAANANNGLADVGEKPVGDGVAVELKDANGNLLATTTTQDGYYLFSGLVTGSYQVCVAATNFAADAILSGYSASTGGTVADANTNIDGDDNGSDDVTQGLCSNLVVLDDNEPTGEATAGTPGDDGVGTADNRSNLTVDFGVVPPKTVTPMSVGDYLWIDANQDGLQGAEETALAGAVVTLLDKDGNAVTDLAGNAVAAITTGADGKYLFSNLPEGEYQISVAVPTGYIPTQGGADVDDNTANNDSNCSAQADGSVKTSLFTLTAGQEPDSAIDGDDTNGNLTVDCGFYQPTEPTHSIGNKVWIDDGAGTVANANNGVLDAGEGVVADGVSLELRDKNGTVLNSTTTSKGYYIFSGLAAGDYQVCVAASNFATGGVLAGYTASTGGNETDANLNVDNNDNGSDDTAAGLCSNVITLGADEPTGETDTASGTAGDDGMGTEDARSNLTVDFAVVPPVTVKTVTVGDYLWVDSNSDGQQGQDETPLAWAVVTLLDKDGSRAKDNDGAEVASVTTDATGKYVFSNLPEGDYQIDVQAPQGYSVTSSGADPDEDPSNTDNNCAVQTDGSIKTALFTLTVGGEPEATTDGDDTNGNLTVDCGFTPPPTAVAVGDYLWIDANQDGQQAENESALAGAVVTLLDKDGNAVKDLSGNAVDAVTTDATGKYLFSNLPEGDYQISVKAPDGYIPTQGGADIDSDTSNTDSNCSAQADGSVKTALFTLTAGQEPDSTLDGDDANSNLTADCGFYQPTTPTHSIGNMVWVDDGADTTENANNGQFDTGESRVTGNVSVQLLDSNNQLISTTQTVDGYYLFSGLAAGSYKVCLPATNFATGNALAGYIGSSNGDEADANSDGDNNDNGDNILEDGLCSNVIVLDDQEPTKETPTASGTAGDDGMGTEDARSNLTVDFGVLPAPQPAGSVSVGDYIWDDANANGVQDAGESPLAGVVVSLLNADGTPVLMDDIAVSPVTTDSTGKYLFSGLAEGDYIIRIVPPTDYIPTVNAGDVDDVPSNTDSNCAVVGTMVQTAAFTLSADGEPTDDGDSDASTNLSVDCGLYQPKKHSIGNMLWIDNGAGTEANANNGTYDSGESPIADGVSVQLLNSAGTVVASTTSSNGYYLFSGLDAGDYQVCVAASNFTDSGLLAGYTASAGQDTGNTDNNDNGDSTTSDGVCSTVITLDDSQPTGETPSASGTAGSDGQGTDDARSNLTIDFGFVPPVTPTEETPVSVGNWIWLDSNANGQQDEGEEGVAGAVVTLTDASGRTVTDLSGNAVNAQTTGTDGKYQFSNLPAGEYMITVAQPSGLYLSVGGVDVDSDASDTDSNCRVNASNNTIQTYPFTLTAGLEPDADGDDSNTNSTVDCGFYGAVSVGNKIWNDADADGQQDSDESGISGAVVTLYDADGVTLATDINGSALSAVTTGTDGQYQFDNLKPGDYLINVAPGTGYSVTTGGDDADSNASDTDNNCKAVDDGFQTLPITLTPGAEPAAAVDGDDTNSNSTLDCGFFHAMSLGQRVWIDLDADGKQDTGEPGVPGAVITLLTADGQQASDIYGNLVAPQTTDADGNYLFGNLREGSYLIKVVPPAGYTATTSVSDPNNDDSTDSNGITQTDGSVISNPITLEYGEEPQEDGTSNQTVAFGFVVNLQIPTLSQWGTALLSLLLGAAAWLRRRRED